MIQTDQNKSFYLDYNTGEKLWKVKNQIYLANPIHNIALGYKYSNMSGPTNLLEGINLADGSVIWEREINNDYGWQYLYYFNDSILLLAANGLHTINLKNGSGWDYHSEMGIQKASIGLSVLRDVKSNLIIDSLNIYCASREKLFKLNQQDGSEQWSFALPVQETAKSRIFIEDSTLFMVNFGYAFMGYRQVVQGTPFIAAFNKKTGENKYFNIINVKKDPVQSLWTRNDTLILAFKNRLEKYSLNDGEKIYEKNVDAKKYSDLLFFVGYQTYLKTSENKYEPVPGIVPSNNYLLTENQKILVLDKDFIPVNEIDKDSIFIHYTNSSHYKFIANEDLTVVLDADNFVIAEFTSSKNSVLIDKKMFSMYKENFLEVDLSGLIFD
jgi:outer membrane protein assembly factor BamB